MQETEIQTNYPESTLNGNSYELELELSTTKKWSGIYLKSELNYFRRADLEKKTFTSIVDIKLAVQIRIICIYRSFRPPNQMTPDNFFLEQLRIIQNALCSNCYVVGDFNLDANMCNCLDYGCRIPLKLLTDFALENNRDVKGSHKSALFCAIFLTGAATYCGCRSV